MSLFHTHISATILSVAYYRIKGYVSGTFVKMDDGWVLECEVS